MNLHYSPLEEGGGEMNIRTDFPFRVSYTDEFRHQQGSGGRRKTGYGTAVGMNRIKTCYRIIWDGTTSKQTCHISFIKIVPNEHKE